MKRIVGLFVVLVTLAACGAGAVAQQPKKVPRIGYLSGLDGSACCSDSLFETFQVAEMSF